MSATKATTAAANQAVRMREALGLSADGKNSEQRRTPNEIADALQESAAWLKKAKFEAEDMDSVLQIGDELQELRVWTHRWLIQLAASERWSFLEEMHTAFFRWGSLTDGQAKGVANCALAEARKRDAQNAEEETREHRGPVAVTDGMYRNPETEEIFKVQKAVHGSGNLYAKRLQQYDDGTWKFNFAPGAVRALKPEWRMTLEEAKAFGQLYGVCCVCGRTLTDETSIAEGIGPICSGRL